MKPIEDLLNLLKKSLTLENPTILTLGPRWFHENIFLPVSDLTTIDINIGKFDETQSTIFCMALQAMGDIAFLLRGFGTANYWYKKIHSFDIKDQEIFHELTYDLAFTYELIRDFDNARRYYQDYFGGDYEFVLPKEDELESPIQIYICDQLFKFQPNIVINNYLRTDQIEIYRLVTMAYFMSEEELETDVYSRMEYYFNGTSVPSLDYVDLFYAADYFCNQPTFWEIILKNKPNILLTDHNFDLQSSENPERKTNVDDTILLHLARTSNNLKSMKNFLENDYLFSAANTCIEFFNEKNHMPNWIEFYMLMNTLNSNRDE